MGEIVGLLFFLPVFCVLLIISYSKFHKFINPVSIIGLWFGIWCLVSCTKYCGYVINFNYGRLYIISNVFCLMVFFVIFVSSNGIISTNYNNQIQVDEQKTFLGKVHVFATNICTFFVIFFVAYVMYSLYTGRITLSGLRTAVYTDASSGGLFSSLISNIYFVFLKGYIVFDVISEIVNIILKYKKVWLLPFVNLMLFALSTSNRIEVVRTVIIFLIAILLCGKGLVLMVIKNKFIKRTITVLAVAIVAVVVFRYIVNGREGGLINSAIYTVVKDFSLSYVTFDIFFEQYNQGLRLVDCNIFDILFGGIVQIAELFIRPFTGIEFTNFNGILALRADYGINIGADKILMANAFYTMYYNFVSGGGIFVPYIVSSAFGCLLAAIYNKWNEKNTPRFFAILIFSMHIVLMGILRWEFYAHWAWVTLFCLLLFVPKSNNTISN